MNKNYDIIKLVTQSLVKCHRQAVVGVGDGQLDHNTLVDGRYPHSEVSLPYYFTTLIGVYETIMLISTDTLADG